LSIFTRYDFDKTGPFKGLSVGGGAARVGGRWESTGGMVYTAAPLPSELRLRTGTNVNAFVNYSFNRHWLVRVSCSNVLNDSYPLGSQAANYNDPSPPRTFTFETIWKF
jgi:outer membrane receptor protein involved in Fe transport